MNDTTIDIINEIDEILKNKDSVKTAVITGITGQDGAYLAQLLLSKDYKVVGIMRRSSVDTTIRLRKLNLLKNPNFILAEGDVTDILSLQSIINKYQPDEVYNLAAQSHVHTSFEQPSFTWEVNAKGCLNLLETIRSFSPHARFYQASTSEMFGVNYGEPVEIMTPDGPVIINRQNEDTKFEPTSPYAVAKLAAHQTVQMYRRAYGMHASAGVLYNHETITYNTPLICKIDDQINILPIGDIARFHTGVDFDMNGDYQSGKVNNDLYVWDQYGWTKVKHVSGYPHKFDKSPRIINSRNSVYAATGSHVCIMNDQSEKETSDLNLGDKVKLIDLPDTNHNNTIGLEEAEWLGMLVGDGNISGSTIRLCNKDMEVKQHFAKLWNNFVTNGRAIYNNSYSGFTGKNIGYVSCCGKYDRKIDIYTDEVTVFGHKTKKVPKCILNASKDIMEAFLIGYNVCDGLKKNKCTYRFKNFKTNSHTLALGLIYLISNVTGQKYNITVEESWRHGKQQFYYSINLLSDNKSPFEKYLEIEQLRANNSYIAQRAIHRQTGIGRQFIRKVFNGYVPSNEHRLQKCQNEIKKIIDIPNYDGWFFDLETESGTFHAGAGQGVVHNSPLRGDNFVTKKITMWLAENYIKYKGEPSLLKKEDRIHLGNLYACRDWGHSKEYCEAMYIMLQQDEPDDYVIATGETHTVLDFVCASFKAVGWNDDPEYVKKFIYVDPEFFRPSEVPYLLGDATKAREKLGWQPTIGFEELVEGMVKSDIEEIQNVL